VDHIYQITLVYINYIHTHTHTHTHIHTYTHTNIHTLTHTYTHTHTHNMHAYILLGIQFRFLTGHHVYNLSTKLIPTCDFAGSTGIFHFIHTSFLNFESKNIWVTINLEYYVGLKNSTYKNRPIPCVCIKRWYAHQK